MRLYLKASTPAAVGLAVSLCVVGWLKFTAVLSDESPKGSAPTRSNRDRDFQIQRMPTKRLRNRTQADEASICKGIPMQQAKRLLSEAGATDISPRIQTTPVTRLIVTEDNAYKIADEYQIPREPTAKEMSELINSMFDQRLPRFAELSYWILPDGTEAELYATGEDKNSILISSIAVYPNGYPKDKIQIESDRVAISRLRVWRNEVRWKSDAEIPAESGPRD